MKLYKSLFIDDREVDNFLNRLMVKEDDLPVEAYCVYGVDEAMQYLKDVPEEDFPELVFIDIDMPLKTGFDFVEEYHSLFSDKTGTHLFFLTGMSDPETKKKAEEIQVIKGIYQKPIRKSVMESVLNSLNGTV